MIEELIKLSKDITNMDNAPKEMGLSDYEYGFYTAIANNDSAREVIENETIGTRVESILLLNTHNVIDKLMHKGLLLFEHKSKADKKTHKKLLRYILEC